MLTYEDLLKAVKWNYNKIFEGNSVVTYIFFIKRCLYTSKSVGI